MTEATQVASKKIIGAPMILYKLSSVSNAYTLTTTFGEVKAAFISTYDPNITGTPVYASYTKSGSTLTFYVETSTSMDVLVWGQ